MQAAINRLHNELLGYAAPEPAKKMAAYMLNQFEFLGLAAPLRRQLAQIFIKNNSTKSPEELLELVDELWNLPQREFQYIAIDLLQKNTKKLNLTHLMHLMDLATQKSWWDTVDGLAAVCNKIFRQTNKTSYLSLLQEARHSENVWIRRIIILHQLGWKKDTDEGLLFSLALQNASDTNFFIRKAIGWALRDYAKYDADSVYTFIDENKSLFSGLTYREAAKHRVKLAASIISNSLDLFPRYRTI